MGTIALKANYSEFYSGIIDDMKLLLEGTKGAIGLVNIDVNPKQEIPRDSYLSPPTILIGINTAETGGLSPPLPRLRLV